jgi:putative FmdB family regulatory protein
MIISNGKSKIRGIGGGRMATYEFHCQKCDLNFELMFSFGKFQKKIKPIRCPNCASTRVIRRISVFEVRTSKKS